MRNLKEDWQVVAALQVYPVISVSVMVSQKDGRLLSFYSRISVNLGCFGDPMRIPFVTDSFEELQQQAESKMKIKFRGLNHE